jgi:3-phenylpropionate/trans-cinnamate dioxygenase ferredoxin component
MPAFVQACATSEIAPGTGRTLIVGGKDVAVFNVDGTFYAIDNTCPHRGGPLGEGELEGCAVTCPWHAWTFDLKTGESLTDDLKVACYETKVEGGSVLVGV